MSIFVVGIMFLTVCLGVTDEIIFHLFGVNSNENICTDLAVERAQHLIELRVV